MVDSARFTINIPSILANTNGSTLFHYQGQVYEIEEIDQTDQGDEWLAFTVYVKREPLSLEQLRERLGLGGLGKQRGDG